MRSSTVGATWRTNSTSLPCGWGVGASVVNALDEAASNWGVKVLRYEIKDLTPPAAILHSMQAQITAEREKRALIAASEGRRQEQINIATGEREAFIARSEGEKQAEINKAQGEAGAIKMIAAITRPLSMTTIWCFCVMLTACVPPTTV